VSAESKNLNRKSVEFVHKGKPRASMSHKEYKEPLQWLMPVIPAMKEIVVRMILVRSHHRAKI
jgi:hypothetical protein